MGADSAVLQAFLEAELPRIFSEGVSPSHRFLLVTCLYHGENCFYGAVHKSYCTQTTDISDAEAVMHAALEQTKIC